MARWRRGHTGTWLRVLVPFAALAAVWIGFAMIYRDGQARPASTPQYTPEAITAAEFPIPRPVTGDTATSADRSIDTVPLQPDTEARSGIMLGRWTGELTEANPYAWTVLIVAGTIVDVQEAPDHSSIWVALALRGDRLTRSDSGAEPVHNLDGSTTPLYNYTGLTAWVRFNQGVAVFLGGSTTGIAGLDALRPHLAVGTSLSEVSIYPGDGGHAQYLVEAEMDRATVRLLDDSIGRPNSRTDQAFRFGSGLVFIDQP
jgi:hypothetical protein